MFFSGLSDIPKIAKRAETAIFALNLDNLTEVALKPFFILEPNDKGKIPIEATRELLDACTLKQQKDAYIIINHAETLSQEAENALLKLLEEPRENYHFLIFTPDPSLLLPTILSRAEIYYPAVKDPLSTPVSAPDDVKTLARELLSIKSRDLPAFAEKIAKKKSGAREYALSILAAAVEISYKSYFATKNPRFLAKLPALITCHNNISQNGHIKLHLIADLL